MPIRPGNPVLDHLRRVAAAQGEAERTDGQLLDGFLSRRDEAAFAAIVRRHGPMVLGVCRRVLRNHHDAEDAFQATFLVLARKAASVVPRAMLPNWLYGVAYRAALKVRAGSAKRRLRERQVSAMPEPQAPEPDALWRDLQPLLDQELSHLPNNYRVPIVLCDLEGKTGKEAARQLGWPEGTVSSRLARGRALLAKRMARHGLALSGGTLAGVLSQSGVSAGVPAALLASTIQAATLAASQAVAGGLVSAKAAALTEGLLKSMLLTKLKTATAGLLVAGVAALTYGVSAGQQTGPNAEPGKKPAVKAATRPKEDTELIQGTVKRDKDKPAAAHGPPPRFLTVGRLDAAKGEVVFDVQVVQQMAHDQLTLLVYPDGEQRLTLGAKPAYVHLGDGFRASLKKSKWWGVDGKEIAADAVAKRLKPGLTVLLSADGAEVGPGYLQMFQADTLVLVVPADELPLPYSPHVGGSIPVKQVGGR